MCRCKEVGPDYDDVVQVNWYTVWYIAKQYTLSKGFVGLGTSINEVSLKLAQMMMF